VPLFDKTHVLDVPRHVARLLLSLRDVSGSGFWFLACQSWLTLHSFLITIVSGAWNGRGHCMQHSYLVPSPL
jgi:hypothetical protein